MMVCYSAAQVPIWLCEREKTVNLYFTFGHLGQDEGLVKP